MRANLRYLSVLFACLTSVTVLGQRQVYTEHEAELLQAAIEEERLQEAITRTEVMQALSESRDDLRADPTAATVRLKNIRESVKASPSLSSKARAELLERLSLGLRQLAQRRIQKRRLDDVARANVAELEARKQAMHASVRQRDIVQAYLDQVNALLDEQRFELSEQVADELLDKVPRSVAPQVVLTKVQQIVSQNRISQVHQRSHAAFNNALYQVELSHVPTPDNPPISYLPANEWRALTKRREARYAQPDMSKRGVAERRITSELLSNTTVDFQDESLANAMSVLEELHGIPIEFDRRAMDDENVDTSDTVSLDVSNITLRSVLRLLLKELDLTYVIENEVVMITTKARADEMVITRVYPVGDLVMPVSNLLGMAAGGNGAGLGAGMGNTFGQGGGRGGLMQGGGGAEFGAQGFNRGGFNGGGRNGGGIF